ncbi:MAG: hypothetical protein MJA27_20895 [Pseudanabaenales cyanobacterium]|nr:hypothetical protein [Pseudanabaenales cyanobacterium]
MISRNAIPLLLSIILLGSSSVVAQSIEEIAQQGEEVIIAYNRALEIDPDFRSAQDNLATVEAAMAVE